MGREADGRDRSRDDPALVSRMASGDRSALAQLYDRHAPTLMALAVRILGGEKDAPDLLHDVFLESWERASTYDVSRGSVRTWLAVRLRSRALDRLGSASARRDRALEGDDGERGVMNEVDVDRVGLRRALAELPDGVRSCLELTYFEGLSASEIASQLDVPVGTVKSRRARGLSLLEAMLQDRSDP